MIYRIIISLFLLWATPSFAGYLTIGGGGNLALTSSGENLVLQGEYAISNAGDEIAHHVFPSFSIGEWSFAGEPKSVGINGKETWTLETKIDPKQLIAKGSTFTALKGMYPLLIRRHYEDSNGAKFSAADVELLIVGELTHEELGAIRAPKVKPDLSCNGNGETFKCTLKILNTGKTPLPIEVSYHGSLELQTVSKPVKVEVPAQEESTTDFRFRNFSGLTGSSYGVFAVLQWEEHGLKVAEKAGSVVAITRSSYRNQFMIAGVVVFLAAAFALYFFVFRKNSPST